MSKNVNWQTKRNANWNIWVNDDGNTVGNETLTHIVLLDIREELKRLNGLLGCSNFQQIPAILRGIRRDARPKKRKRKP